MVIHLIDGTYELFRHFYGQRRFNKGKDLPFGAVTGVLHTILQMVEKGARHVGVATDHVIESFRNDLWPGYKTSEGIEPALFAQFHPLERSLAAMGIVVWPMVELEADDALASAARLAAADERVEKVCIWTPDKDLAQCVEGDRVVQMHRKDQRHPRCRSRSAEVRRGARAHSGLPRFGRRQRRRLSRDRRHRRGRRRAPHPAVRCDREISPGSAGQRAPCDGASFQEARDSSDRCETFYRCRRSALASSDRCVCRLGGRARRRALASSCKKGSDPFYARG